MRIEVDYDKCQSNAVCEGLAPSVFEVRDDGFLYVINENPPEDLHAAVLAAQAQCPTQAISVSD
ncbi:ferredoxin [Ferrimicrobium sp.]|uniref:ferredoxin n=1 Tax=Ferrimicrobium sp. TaxID=2926050 RepID=UPI0026027145|nr:ferredoxin [Ferrimicrobium sp.]